MNGEGPKGSAFLSNSEFVSAVESWSEDAGVSSVSERGRTQPKVKVPKLLAKSRRVFELSDSRTVGLEAAIS